MSASWFMHYKYCCGMVCGVIELFHRDDNILDKFSGKYRVRPPTSKPSLCPMGTGMQLALSGAQPTINSS